MTLPQGWAWTTIGEITAPIEKVDPAAEPNKPFTYLDISSIDNTTHVIREPKAHYGADAPSRARQRVHADDVLFSTVRTYLKNIAQVPQAYDGQIASTGFSVLRGKEGISSKYLFYFSLTTNFLSALAELQRGTSYPAVRDGDVRAQPIPLAPTVEQHHIVAEIEKQFTRLDAGVAALRQVQANLKRYKASVLKAACEGRLAAQDPNDEPASALLGRILAERRAKWEQDLHAKGKDPSKAKYEEPQPPDTDGLPELPEGWCWASVEQTASSEARSIQSGPFGSELHHSEFQDSGVLAIGIDNVLESQFSIGKQHRISSEKFKQLSRFVAHPLDVLITVMATVGRCCVLPADIEPAVITKHIYRISTNQMIMSPYFLMYSLLSVNVKQQILGKVQGQTRPGINGEILRGITVPVPPLAEQRRIVAEVEWRLSVVQEVEGVIAANLARAERLRQSILKQAFEGKLARSVQDAKDEPASALLERIRAQRAEATPVEAASSGKRARRKSRA